MDYAVLHPDVFGADGDGLVDYRGDLVGAAENVDQIDGFGDGWEVGVGYFAEGFLDGGVDGDDAVALLLEVGGDAVAVAVGVVGQADYGDGFAVA